MGGGVGYVCVGVRVSGCLGVGVWVCRCVGVWVCGCVLKTAPFAAHGRGDGQVRKHDLARSGPLLSHKKCLHSGFAKVNSHINQSTYFYITNSKG